MPIDELPPADQLPAAPLLIAAYAFVWVAVLFYVWTIWRRLDKVEKDMQALARRRRAVTAGHFIFIPSVLLVGVVIGWILGIARGAKDAYAAELRRREERATRNDRARRGAARRYGGGGELERSAKIPHRARTCRSPIAPSDGDTQPDAAGVAQARARPPDEVGNRIRFLFFSIVKRTSSSERAMRSRNPMRLRLSTAPVFPAMPTFPS